ncbi:MAG: T9SS type A sorting domain-containing protein, partial [Bacteroidia bacterium]
GSCSSSKEVTVSIGTNLGLAATPAPTTYCSGGSSTITATGASNYTWQPGNLTGSVQVVNPTSNVTYTINGTAGACSGTTTVLMNVDPTPTIIATALNSTVCVPGSGTTLFGSGASTYTWQPGNLVGANVAVNPNLTTTYTVTGTTGAGCVSSKTVLVNAFNKPFVNAASSSATTCAGVGVQLFATGATSYIWNPGTLSGSNVTVAPTSNTTYTVTGTTNGCSDSKMVTITVSPCTGLQSLSPNSLEVSVYPNPFKDELHVNVNEAVSVNVYNALGQKVISEKISSAQNLNTTELPQGVYIIKVAGAKESKTFRMIKQ